MRYVYAEDVIGTTDGLSGCRGCGGFGQSGPYSAAVAKLQQSLKSIAAETDDVDYDPGKVDGKYGLETHAALLRVSRDFLEPQGLVESTCRSTCNTLRLRARSACADCIEQILRAYNDARLRLTTHETGVGVSLQDLAGFGSTDADTPNRLTDAEIAEVADRYKAFLDAYIAKYGDGGELDPRQIARREGVSLEEAERLAAERRAAAEGPAPAPSSPSAGKPPIQKAGFSWWWLVLFLGLGGAMWYAWRKRREEDERGWTLPEDVTEYTGLGRRPSRKSLPPLGGCGCGG
jgi:peptidoglycan hydrolase-like protein with peptidoglycan-binding domain